MDLGLKGKSVLVTASSKGLGKATALRFAAEGAKVMISSRSVEALHRTAAEIKEATGNEVGYFAADMRKAEDVKGLVRETASKYGTVHVLVNNTGGPPAGNFDNVDDDAWQNAFELVLLSMIRCIREVVPYMRMQKFGRIVNFASSSIKQPLDNLILSNTFRTGIMGLAKSLAAELAPDNILINTVGPGRIATDRVAFLDEERAGRLGISVKEVKESTERLIPVGRYGEPDEFARAAIFLASSANSYVTGQALLVDGGLVRAL